MGCRYDEFQKREHVRAKGIFAGRTGFLVSLCVQSQLLILTQFGWELIYADRFPYDHSRSYCPSSCPNDLSYVLTTVQTNLCVEFCTKMVYRVTASKAYVPAGQDTDWRIPRSDSGASFLRNHTHPERSRIQSRRRKL